jgi:riboflavin synthase
MFTGLIQQVCSVKTSPRDGNTAVLSVDIQQQAKVGLPRLTSGDVKTGDSIAVNGVCLTVVKLEGSLATFDLSAETLSKTNLGKLTTGSKVNIEPAIRADDRFGGHFVLGHIDGVATIRSINKQGDFANIAFSAPKELLDLMLPKGSVAVDGVSLTIADLNDDGFTVALIPQTLKQTTLAEAKINQTVNIECDIIIKTVKRHLEKLSPQNRLTIEGLRQQGF